MLPLAGAVNVARHALKRGQQAEHNVGNPLLLPRKVLHTDGFHLSGHFYIISTATLSGMPPNTLLPIESSDQITNGWRVECC